jgi:hypothetical protein
VWRELNGQRWQRLDESNTHRDDAATADIADTVPRRQRGSRVFLFLCLCALDNGIGSAKKHNEIKELALIPLSRPEFLKG